MTRQPTLQDRISQLTNVQVKQEPVFSPERVYLGINVTITGFIPDADGAIALEALDEFSCTAEWPICRG